MEKAQSASVESIPEVLEECASAADHSDSASVHDMDYVNPRGVRFTQSSQKEGGHSLAGSVYSPVLPTGLPKPRRPCTKVTTACWSKFQAVF